MSQDSLGNALTWVAAGHRVFPLDPVSRTPLVKRWRDVATSDSASVLGWGASHPGCMWGSPTGELCFALDVDVDATTNGWASLAMRGWVVTPAPGQTTLSGGSHLFYQMPPGDSGLTVRNAAPILLPGPKPQERLTGVDLRGLGGYVTIYQPWPAHAVIPSPPQWLADLAWVPIDRRHAVPVGESGLPDWPYDVDHASAIARLALEQLARAVQGERNHTLNRTARTIGAVAYALPEPDAWFEMMRVTARGIGLDDREIEATGQSGWASGQSDPMAHNPAALFAAPCEVPAGAIPYEEGRPFLRHDPPPPEEYVEGLDGRWTTQQQQALEAMVRTLVHVETENKFYRISSKAGEGGLSWEGLVTATSFLGKVHSECGMAINDKRVKSRYLAEVWRDHRQSKRAASITYRPDLPSGHITEDRRLNLYQPADWASAGHTGGSIDVWLRFIEHLVPDPTERDYVCRWLAYKLRYPATVGPALVMVAHSTYGTGRGRLSHIIEQLFGPHNVARVDFEQLSGRSNRAQYNAWQAHSLWALVDEALEPNPDVWSDRAAKRAYETLKRVADPSARRVEINPKFGRTSVETTYTQVLIATNHRDAIYLPPDDRRFAVVSNGDRMTLEQSISVMAWADDPANIAALDAWMRQYPLGDYHPAAQVPMTESRQAMIGAGKDDLEDDLTNFTLPKIPGRLMTTKQVIAAMPPSDNESPSRSRALGYVLRRHLCSLDRRVWYRGVKQTVFARTNKEALRWSKRSLDEITAELDRNETTPYTGP